MLSHRARTARPRHKVPEAKGPSSARSRESLSWSQGAGLSPPRPAWEDRGTRVLVGTEALPTCQTCSPHLGPATPCPEPWGQPNQPGQVWASMPGTAVTALHPHLPTSSVPLVAQSWLCPCRSHQQLWDGCLPHLSTCIFSRGSDSQIYTPQPGISQLRDKKQQCKVTPAAGKSPGQEEEEAERGSSVG